MSRGIIKAPMPALDTPVTAAEAEVFAEHQPPCPCGHPIRTVEVDTTRGITAAGRSMQVPKTITCEAGHVREVWIDWPVQ